MQSTMPRTQPTKNQAPFAISQRHGRWFASWNEPHIGIYEVSGDSESEVERKVFEQRQETVALQMIETWMDLLSASGLLPEAIDIYLTDALFAPKLPSLN